MKEILRVPREGSPVNPAVRFRSRHSRIHKEHTAVVRRAGDYPRGLIIGKTNMGSESRTPQNIRTRILSAPVAGSNH